MITLRPLGSLNPDLTEYLSAQISSTFGKARVEAPMPLPSESYVPKRGQFDGSCILQALAIPDEDEVLLGVTKADLFLADLNFVFGLAYRNVALISIKRLRPQFYGLQPDDGILKTRALKEAMHELGHVFGLSHCADEKCVMHFSSTIHDTDFKDWHYCKTCARAIAAAGLLKRRSTVLGDAFRTNL